MQRKLLLLQMDSRLDKERFLKGECVLTDGGSCFHIRISVAAFPKTRERAISSVKVMFG
ncbi:hypothetical protein HY640_04950 [Candidatus Woesearchaeota archaeon]|nr:hypothetical protein [Candidatus Woesearchaeota archaeon]